MSVDPLQWRTRLDELIRAQHARSRQEAADGLTVDRLLAARRWQSDLVDNGLAGPGWPREAGGMDLGLDDQLDYYRIITAGGVPSHPCPLSFILAPTLIRHGTQEQKDRFLDPLLRADELWCQGFSEPGAGSDLASLSTRAVRDGDEYVVTGQKVWTTQADRADWIFALVRTGPPGRGTSGITYLLIPTDAEGVTVRPLRDLSGATHFAELFFDNVRVPVANRVGAEGEGWSIMRTSLGLVRATAFLADEFRYRSTVDQVTRLVVDAGLGDDPVVLQEVARLESGVQAIAANSARALDAILRGEEPGGVASVNRLVKSEFEQQLHQLALRATGPAAMLGNRAIGARQRGRWTYGYLMSRATTIGAGTAEIQRNTIAAQVLGLPSHRGEGTKVPAVPVGTPLATADDAERGLREVLAKLLHSAVDVAALLDWGRSAETFDRDLWSALVGFGLPGLAVDPDLDGSGASARLLCAAVEESGRALAPVPLVPTLAALAVAEASGAEGLVRRIVTGATAALVVPLGDDGWVLDDPELPTWNGLTLTGEAHLVPGAPAAEILVVVARTLDGELAVVSVEPAAATVSADQALDLTATIGAVSFAQAPGQLCASGPGVSAALASARQQALLALAADSVGVAARALALAVSWAGQREQFGQPIGAFQAVSHRCADLAVALEGARSQVLAAAESEDDDPQAVTLTELAAAAALDAAVTAAEGCIQIHGGIGFTWEHEAHLILRRAQANAAWMGRPDRLRDHAGRSLLSRVQRPETK